jgi:F-type H+/Na+-transporting ATPase subunit alpha
MSPQAGLRRNALTEIRSKDMLSFFILADSLRGVEKAQNARQELLSKITRCLRLSVERRQLSAAWDLSGRFDNHNCYPLKFAGPGAESDAVVAASGMLTRALCQSAQPWRYQRALVELARETGQVRLVAQCVLQALRQIDSEQDCGRKKGSVRGGPAGGVLGRGACVWDALQPLAGVMEELWCYQDWHGVSEALKEDFAAGAGRFAPFTIVEAVYGMAQWAQARHEAEPLERAIGLIRLFYSRPGDTRRAVLLLAQPLAQDGAGASLSAALGDCARAAADDEDVIVRSLGRALEWRLAGASERRMIQALFLNETEQIAFNELRQTADEEPGSLNHTRELTASLLAGLEALDPDRRLARIMALAHMVNYYPPSQTGFRLYWETVARQLLLPLLQSAATVVAWTAAVALRSVIKSVISRNALLADAATVYLFEEVSRQPSLPSSMACWALGDALDDSLRWELVARLGVQSRSSPSRLRFATAALLSRASGTGTQPAARLLSELAGESDPVGRACASWALRRLKLRELAVHGSAAAAKGDGEAEKLGKVGRVGAGLIELERLPRATPAEILACGDMSAFALRLGTDKLGTLCCGNPATVEPGNVVSSTGWRIKVPVGDKLIGRVVNSFGRAVDGRGPLMASHQPLATVGFESLGPPRPACEFLLTGLKAVDLLTPIKRGHCMLIIGDRGTGKTSLALDTIINQKGGKVVCIYVAVGQEPNAIEHIVGTLRSYGAMEYTVVISSTASDPPLVQQLAPYTGAAIGRQFSDEGRHALTIYDALRSRPLLDERTAFAPTALAKYSDDSSYMHALMLEQLVGLSRVRGAGSLTSLLVLDTQGCDVPSGVTALSDGHLFLDRHLFDSGVRPAVSLSKSASPVGAAEWPQGVWRLSDAWRSMHTAGETAGCPAEAERLAKVMNQRRHHPLELWQQALIIWAGSRGHLDNVPVEEVCQFETRLFRFVEVEHPQLTNPLSETETDMREVEAELERILARFQRTRGSRTSGRARWAARAASY